MTRRYARAPRGVRVHETTPEGNWKILTILGAMSLGGMIATMTIEAATDSEIFLAYLDHVLCPTLRPGDVVVMDNLSSHKVAGVRERIAAAGAELLYLPPIRPISIPSRKHGPSSNNCSVLPKPEPPRHSNKLSPTFCQPSDHKMLKPGSEHRFMLYSKEEYALVSWSGIPATGKSFRLSWLWPMGGLTCGFGVEFL